MPKRTEFNIIQTYFAAKTPTRADVMLGIGDDAAITNVPKGQQLVSTIDTLVAGVHFPLATRPEDIAHKAITVNLSDLAAMGATPAWISLALTLPQADPAWLEKFSDSFMALLSRYHLQLIGGDMTQGPLSISVQAQGFIPKNRALQRSGAQVGDQIYVSGTLGDAAAGLALLQQAPTPKNPNMAYFSQKLNRPEPRVEIGLALREIAHSAIDISDGLCADLGHILEQSHVGATIHAPRIPLSAPIQQHFTQKQALQYALTGGDDYELCVTLAPQKTKQLDALKLTPTLTPIGYIEKRPGLRIVDASGNTIEYQKRGYQHFKDCDEA